MSDDVRDRPAAPGDPSLDASQWWSTAITSIRTNEILICGYPIEELIGELSFPGMLLLMTTGEVASPARVALLEAAMVASVDHGPQAPSVAAGRMAATCGVGFQSVVAAGVSLLGDIHGGAGQQCLEMLDDVLAGDPDTPARSNPADRARDVVDARLGRGEFIPGLGHRYHRVDPRATRLVDLVQRAVADGEVDGRHLAAIEAVADVLALRRGRRLPINIDGATAMIYGEIGLSAELARAVFVLSRSVGIVANAWEERRSGSRLKGPIPRGISPAYVGPPRRHLADGSGPHPGREAAS